MLQEAIKLLKDQSDRFRKAFSLNNRAKGLKQRKAQTSSAKSVSRQQAIYNIIEANGREMHITDIENAVQLLEEHKEVSYPTIRYNVEILIDNGRITNPSYAHYAINKNSNNEG